MCILTYQLEATRAIPSRIQEEFIIIVVVIEDVVIFVVAIFTVVVESVTLVFRHKYYTTLFRSNTFRDIT